MSAHNPQLGERLSDSERRVLHWISFGLHDKEIPTRVHLSENTVKTHVAHLLKKLGARNRAHAVRLAFEQGLLRSGVEVAALVAAQRRRVPTPRPQLGKGRVS